MFTSNTLTFVDIAVGTQPAPALGTFAWVDNGLNGVNLQYTAVPEPSSIFAALGLAMCGGWYARRRMKKGASSGVKAKNDDELNV